MHIFAVLLLLPALTLANTIGDTYGNALFPLINTNKDLIITKLELIAFVKLFDLNNDGKLYFSEFLLAVKLHAPGLIGKELLLYFVLVNNKAGPINYFIDDAYNKIDNDYSGGISIVELRSLFTLGLKLSLNVNAISEVYVKIGK